MKPINFARSTLIVSSFAACLLLAGCGTTAETTSVSEPEVSSKEAPQPAVHTRLKLGKPGDDFEQVKYTYSNEDDHLIERETLYRDKHIVHEYPLPDGTGLARRYSEYEDKHTMEEVFFTSGPGSGKVMKESKETYRGGVGLREHIVYNDKGGVLTDDQFREDSTLQSARVVHPDGTYDTTLFLDDGKTRSSVEICNPDGSFETRTYRSDGIRLFHVEQIAQDMSRVNTFYRHNGKTIWAIQKSQYGQVSEILVNKPDGTLDQTRIHKDNNSVEVTVYRSAGTGLPAIAKFCQTYVRIEAADWWVRKYRISSVVKYRADGKTIEKSYELFVDLKTVTVKQATIFNLDGTKIVRCFRSAGGTLEKEMSYDTAGNVTKTSLVDEKKAIHEKVDDELVREPPLENPADPKVSRD